MGRLGPGQGAENFGGIIAESGAGGVGLGEVEHFDSGGSLRFQRFNQPIRGQFPTDTKGEHVGRYYSGEAATPPLFCRKNYPEELFGIVTAPIADLRFSITAIVVTALVHCATRVKSVGL